MCKLKLIFCLLMLSGTGIVHVKPDLHNSTTLELWEFQTSPSWVLENGTLILKQAGTPSGPIRK
ncbi:MAG: hypothetical protein MN733_42390, partial [Nitrososphaera sp.]|nr:hypothetical protein [Nitrososphaera sp.]